MATQVQRRRGTTAQHAAFSGQLAELTVDTDKMTVVVQDGSTLGGHPLAKEANLSAHIVGTTDAHDASAISVLDTAANFTATDVEGVLAELAASGGLTYFIEAENTAAPNGTVYVDSLTASATSTNADIAIVPKGTGAILGDVPDNLSSGGNKRGSRGVDFQMVRALATQVASGAASVIVGGSSNTASGLFSAVCGGDQHVSSGTNSVVAGGSKNTASGLNSGALSGSTNTASASGSLVCGGSNNTANNTSSTVVGGASNSADGPYSVIPGGRDATARTIHGRYSFASGMFSIAGDAQIGVNTLFRSTPDATPLILTSTGAGETATNVSVLPNNHSYTVSALITARDIATGDTASWKIEGAVKRGANAAATALVGTPTVTSLGADASLATAVVALIADTTLGAAEIRVTGLAATTIRWVCKFDTVEVG